MTKYYEERIRADGTIAYIVNPPKYVRTAVGATFRMFTSRDEAVQHAETITKAYWAQKGEKRLATQLPDDPTVDGLIAHYRETQAWLRLEPNSQRHYDLMLRTSSSIRVGRSNSPFGQMLARNVTAQTADSLYTAIYEAKGHDRANNCVKVLRRVFSVSLRHSKVSMNPFSDMELEATAARKVRWEPEHVQTFIQKADALGKGSIGTIILMCYHLCQRPGDVRQLTWGNYKDGVFCFAQEKTGTEIEVPASPELQQRLSQYVRGADSHAIVTSEVTGKPYSDDYYSKTAAKVRDAAGLPSFLQVRDLRRTGATEMAEAGSTEDELRSVTGHKSRNILNTYVVTSRKMAAAGITKRFG